MPTITTRYHGHVLRSIGPVVGMVHIDVGMCSVFASENNVDSILVLVHPGYHVRGVPMIIGEVSDQGYESAIWDRMEA